MAARVLMDRLFRVEPGSSPNVAVVRCDVKGKTWEQWALVQSDVHWDNPDCDWKLYRRHLEQAKERGAVVLQLGDTFCAMQGKYDKRSDKSKLRPEHQCGDYLDALVRTAADFHSPYAENIAMFAYGNHETAIRGKHETDLIQRLVGTLKDRNPKCATLVGGYSGWVRFMFEYAGARMSKRLWYIHGYGGGGAATKDMQQAHRQMVYVRDADIMCSGHTHHQWEDFNASIRLNDMNAVEQCDFTYLKCGTYKNEYKHGAGGWAVEKGIGPKPLGAWWIKFTIDTLEKKVRFTTERAA